MPNSRKEAARILMAEIIAAKKAASRIVIVTVHVLVPRIAALIIRVFAAGQVQ